MVADGTAPKIVLLKKNLVELKFDKSAADIHNFIRGCDHNPGAWTTINGQVGWVSSPTRTSGTRT